MKSLLILTLVLGTQSIYSAESYYQKLTSAIKSQKMAEEKEGKVSPLIDGVIEPKFPNEEENNKTLEGIDSNNDGVRDDIEIWINRKAEDEFVRWSLKDFYRKFLAIFKAVQAKESLETINKVSQEFNHSVYCSYVMLRPYEKESKSNKKDPVVNYINDLERLILNSSLRVNVQANWNDYPVTKAKENESDAYCSNSPIGKRYEQLKRHVVEQKGKNKKTEKNSPKK